MQRELLLPSIFVQTGNRRKLLGREIQASPVDFAISRAYAKAVLNASCFSFQAVNHPLQNTHVFTVAGPNELAVIALAEPVDAVNGRQCVAEAFELGLHIQPVLEIVAHVVATERQHGKRVATHHAHLSHSRCRGFRTHGGGHVNAFHPGAGFGHQRHGGGAAATKHERINGHAIGVVPLGIQGGVVGGGHRKAGIGVCGFGTCGFGDFGSPVIALPVDQVRGHGASVFLHAFPPHIAIVGQRDIGKDDVFIQTGHAVGVGVEVGSRRYAKVTRFGVDGDHLTFGVWLNPRNIVTNGGDFPTRKASLRRHQHGEIGFATCAGESRSDVVLFAFWVGYAQNQHVLGQPALVAPHGGSDAQGQTLLAQQSIAAVA